ncbi:hypothetical protein [Stenotrophomonas sp. GD03657]|uniref:hypothetical protein n=1 Tax=Stenotrophomonas sp. GD03657 TaxID=2975363 RepID=UPI00244A8E4D|nr:hypothetical protein [Stenotrophomonas sp. GD03657]MDH2154176.1 hypothetical protein [Stenotrophomonas sp. GD03657]
MSSQETVGVVGLKLDEIAAFPKHEFGVEVEFYEGNLAEMNKVRQFCDDKLAVFAVTRNLSTSTLHTLPRKNLYTLGNNISPKALEQLLEKKYGIVKRAEPHEPAEYLEKLERRYNQPVVPVEEPVDPLGLLETWRSSVVTERVIQARYPNDSIIHKTIPYVYGMREDYGFLKAAHPGMVVRYMRSSNEQIVFAEDRAEKVLKYWPERVGYMLEAHIHRDFTDYYITQTRVKVSTTEREVKFLRDIGKVRSAMEAWEQVKALFNDDPDDHVLAVSHEGLEGVTVAVDDDIEVPDSPLSGAEHDPEPQPTADVEVVWSKDWFASITPLSEIYMSLESEATLLEQSGGRFKYGPMIQALPGDKFVRPILRPNGPAVGDAVLKMRYPVETYSPKCGHVIEAHAIGENIFYFVTHVPYQKSLHRNINQITDLNALKTMIAHGHMKMNREMEAFTSSDPVETVSESKPAEQVAEQVTEQTETPAVVVAQTPAPTKEVIAALPLSRTIDSEFWKQIYALSFGRFGDNALAREHAQQALDDLNTLE